VLWSLCTALTIAVIFGPRYLPMVDLPQHAGQIAIWLDWNDPSLQYQHVYRQAPLPPAFVSTALAFALAHVVSVEVALKVVIAIAVLGIPFAVRLLVDEAGGNPWWAFLSFPIGFGFPFGFGFINFCLGVPVALLLVLLSARYGARPSVARAAGLFLTALLLFAIHAIAFGFGVLVAGLVILARSPNLRTAIIRTAPLLLLLPFVFVWILAARDAEPAARTPTDFQLGWHRLLLLPVFLTGAPVSLGASWLVLAMFATPFLGGARISSQPWRWILFLVSVALFLGAPHFVLGTAFIYQRFAVFCIPGLLLALDRPLVQQARRNVVWPSGIAPALALIFLLGVGNRFWRFNIEAEGLTEVLARIPRGARLLYLPVDRLSAVSPFPVYLHAGMWHQVRQGGVTDFSFARFHMNRFRYCDGAAPTLPLDFEWKPEVFDWHQHWGEKFDYFLVRSPDDSRKTLFKDAVDRVTLVDRRHEWWLFRRLASAGSEASLDRPDPESLRRQM
jgi:hypothetical protein